VNRPCLVAALATAFASHGGVSRTADALRICLNEKLRPIPCIKRPATAGFDLAVAGALARHLGRTLRCNGSKASSTAIRARPRNQRLALRWTLPACGRLSLDRGFIRQTRPPQPPRACRVSTAQSSRIGVVASRWGRSAQQRPIISLL